MTKNKSLIVLLTAVLAVGLLAATALGETYKFNIIENSSGSYEAGDDVSLTIEAIDISGTVDKDFTGDVIITGSSEDEALGTVTFEASDDGTKDVTVNPTVAEGTYEVTVTSDADSSVMGTLELGTAVNALGTLGEIELTGPTSSPTVGNTFEVTFTTKDKYGNENTLDSSVDFTLYSNKDGALGTQASSSGGTDVTFNSVDAEKLVSAGSHELTLTTPGKSSNAVSVSVNKKAPTVSATNRAVAKESPTTFVAQAELTGLAKTTDAFRNGREITFTVYDDTDTQVATATAETGASGAAAGVAEHEFELSGASVDDVYTYTASYSSSNYSSVTDTAHVTVNTNYTATNVQIGSINAGATVRANNDLTVVVTVDSSVSADRDVTVTFDPGGSAEVEATATIASTETTSDGAGTNASFSAPTDDVGTYEIKAELAKDAGVADQGPSSDSESITVHPADTLADFDIINFPSSVRANESFEVTVGNMVDPYGNTFDSTNSAASWEAESYEGDFSYSGGSNIATEGNVQDDGTQVLTIAADIVKTVTGSHSIALKRNAKVKPFTMNVDPLKTKVAFTSVEYTTNPDKSFQVTAEVKKQDPNSGDWTAVGFNSAKEITFSFEGETYKADISTSDDTATYGDDADEDDLVAPDSIGQYGLSASWDGAAAADSGNTTTDLASGTGTSTYGVLAQPTAVASITATVDGPIGNDLTTAGDGDEMTIKISGTTADGNPAAGSSLNNLALVSEFNGAISLDSTDTPVEFDSSGEATLKTDTDTLLTVDSAHTFDLTSDEADTSFDVNVKEDVDFDAISGPADGIPLKNFPLVVNLNDQAGNDLETKDVTATLYEVDDADTETKVSSDTATTDSNGDAELALAGPLSAKYDSTAEVLYDYTIELKFAGDADYASETASSTGNSIVSATSPWSVDVRKGWNMISLNFQPSITDGQATPVYLPDLSPSEPVDTKPGELFGNDTGAVFHWDGTTYLSGNELSEIKPTKGYWVYTPGAAEDGEAYEFSDSDGDQAYGRDLMRDVTISLPDSGWNMISSPFGIGFANVKVSDDGGDTWMTTSEAVNAGLMEGALWAYDPYSSDSDDQGYVVATLPGGTVYADMGFWVETLADGLTFKMPFDSLSSPTVTGAAATPASLAEAGFEPAPAGADTPPAPPAAPQAGSSELKANAAVTSEGVTFEVAGADVDSINVQVFSTDGAEVFSESASGNTLSWNAEVANGVYLYGVSAEVNGETKPLGIQKLLILS